LIGLTNDLAVVAAAAAAPEGVKFFPTFPAFLPNHGGFRLTENTDRFRTARSSYSSS